MKDAVDLTFGCFWRIIILPTNRRTLLDNRTALVQKKITQSLGAQRFRRSETCRGTTGLIHTQEVTGSSPVVSTKPLKLLEFRGFFFLQKALPQTCGRAFLSKRTVHRHPHWRFTAETTARSARKFARKSGGQSMPASCIASTAQPNAGGAWARIKSARAGERWRIASTYSG